MLIKFYQCLQTTMMKKRLHFKFGNHSSNFMPVVKVINNEWGHAILI